MEFGATSISVRGPQSLRLGFRISYLLSHLRELCFYVDNTIIVSLYKGRENKITDTLNVHQQLSLKFSNTELL